LANASKVISEEQIDEALIETFPASDPPPWTLGVERREESREKDERIDVTTSTKRTNAVTDLHEQEV
jgi:hypothetical protein